MPRYKTIDLQRSPLDQHQHNHNHAKETDHITADAVSSCCFVSLAPFSLAAWQAWLMNLPQNVLRSKGSLFFREDDDDPSLTWEFHLSGRSRFECSPQRSVGQRSVELVLIGKQLNAPEIIESLQRCVEPSVIPEDAHTAALALLEQVPGRWQMLQQSATTITFRLCPCGELGIGMEDVVRSGLSLNRVNADLACAINGSCSSAFVTTLKVGDDMGIRTAVGPALLAAWPIIEAEATAMCESRFADIKACKCGW
eukprot:c20407_g1_i2.p1 GENE.c20407_g1_i2~~c20407_g1_i2.p1  ORF type:complete len:254 (-),score=47.25 c20407_g1_i2:3-764(-)